MLQQERSISWSEGPPLRDHISPRIGFLDLPQELHDRIYHYSLVTPEPIITWSKSRSTESSPKTTENVISPLEHLGLGLLLCNQQMSRKAAMILYRSNTFRFDDENDWSPLYTFPQTIGEVNRRNLRSIELEVPPPNYVWQDLDGTRTTMSDRSSEVDPQDVTVRYAPRICPGSRIVALPDPAIEDCFRILGNNRPALSIFLSLDKQSDADIYWYFSHESSDLVEECCKEFTAPDGMTSQVNILWRGVWLQRLSKKFMKYIFDKGHALVDAQEEHIHRLDGPTDSTYLTLYREEITAAP